jgi:putative transposase
VCRKYGISQPTFYNRKANFGGIDVSDAKRLRALDDENAKLKRLLAEAMLDNAMLKDVVSKNVDARRKARGGRACCRGTWHERAVGVRKTWCGALGLRCRARRPLDEPLRKWLRALAHARWRFGYRRLFVLLHCEGERSSRNRVCRLSRAEHLSVRQRKGRRRAVGAHATILLGIQRANARWSLDFVHDQIANGRRFRVLKIVDDVTRECIAAIPDTSISGASVSRAS